MKMQNQIQPTRRRVVWSDAEVEILVATFMKNDKPTRSEVAFLIGVLEPGRTEKQVRNWFMNQRSKARKTLRVVAPCEQRRRLERASRAMELLGV